MPQRVRLKDIAEKVGVDKSTVSLALRNDKRVSESTRQRIIEAAESMGYQRDASLEVLSAHRWEGKRKSVNANLALLQFDRETLANKFRELETGAKERARFLNLGLDTFYLSDFPRPDRVPKVLKARGIRGIILGPSDHAIEWQSFPWDRYASVACIHSPTLVPTHSIREAGFESFKLAYQKVVDLGYSSIGLAMVINRWTPIDERRVAAARYLTEFIHVAGQRIDPYFGEFPEAQGLVEWYERYRPALIICSNEIVGRVLSAAGYQPGRDYQLVALEIDEHEPGPRAGIYAAYHQIGERSVDFVVDLLRRSKFGPPDHVETLTVIGRWHQGDVPPAASAKAKGHA